jgi:peptide chain release factor 3
VPVTWPVYRHGAFAGVYHRRQRHVVLFARSGDHGASRALTETVPLDGGSLEDHLGADTAARLREEVALLDAAGHPYSAEAVLAGTSRHSLRQRAHQLRVEPFLEDFLRLAPPPAPGPPPGERGPRPTRSSAASCLQIQANMDPKHRDRVAFPRICSGRLSRACGPRHAHRARHLAGRAAAVPRRERMAVDEAWPGTWSGS